VCHRPCSGVLRSHLRQTLVAPRTHRLQNPAVGRIRAEAPTRVGALIQEAALTQEAALLLVVGCTGRQEVGTNLVACWREGEERRAALGFRSRPWGHTTCPPPGDRRLVDNDLLGPQRSIWGVSEL
jgi:hypothetical protein